MTLCKVNNCLNSLSLKHHSSVFKKTVLGLFLEKMQSQNLNADSTSFVPKKFIKASTRNFECYLIHAAPVDKRCISITTSFDKDLTFWFWYLFVAMQD